MKPTELARLQADFHEHLLTGSPSIAPEVASGGRIDVAHRLHIYHNAYRVRLVENLRDAFEKTWAYLGDDAFDDAAHAFVETHPPRHRNLRWHGSDFPAWLAHRFPDDLDISELAMIDWNLRRAFDGANATPLAATVLATLSPSQWETVGFQLAPTLFLTPMHFNSVAIWQALDHALTPPGATRLTEPAWLLIWRKGWQPHFRTLNEVEHAALSALSGGATFARVCASLGERFSDNAATEVAAASLRVWFDDELIVGLTGCDTAGA